MITAAPSLEELLTQDFGLRTPTPLQRAICRIADGRKLDDLEHHPDVLAAIGRMGQMPRAIPLAVLLCCGIRGGKSQIAGAAATRCGLSCDTSMMTSGGDLPRVAILSTHRDQAKQTYDHLVYAFTTTRLKARLVKEPTDRILFFHDTGRPIEIVVVAGARAGVSLASKWLIAAIFDESAKMVGASEGVVNLDAARQNVAGRLVPSGCCPEWLISSPWAPFGPFFKVVQDSWKRPTRNMVVVRGRGDQMNPSWWTPARIEDVKRNPDAYKTDFLAEFADAEGALIPGVHIEAAVRAAPADVPPENGYQYAAEMDPGVRSNAWTLVVTRMVGKRTQCVLAREWTGSKTEPIDPIATLRAVRACVAPYRVERVGSDQYGIDFIRAIGRDLRDKDGNPTPLEVTEYQATRKSNDEGYTDLAQRFAVGEMEIPDNPNLVSDLRRLVRKTVATGIHIDLPQTSDGRHCDFAPALMRAAQRGTAQPKVADPRPQVQVEQEASLARAVKRYGRKAEVPWWKRSA